MKGVFITFEGIDGAGKSSILKAVYSYFQKTKWEKKIFFTQEPTASAVGNFAKDVVFQYRDLSLDYQAYLFLADRIQHLQTEILPALKQGKIIFCDRYHDSTIAYQGKEKQKKEFFFSMYDSFIAKPDLTLLIDAEINLCQQRLEKRKKKNTFDKKTTAEFSQTRKNYLWLQKKEKERIFLVDNNQELEKAVEQSKKIITKNWH